MMNDEHIQTGGDTGVEPGRESTDDMPRWVKVLGIMALALMLLFIVLHLTGNSPGGPGSHTQPTEQGVQQP